MRDAPLTSTIHFRVPAQVAAALSSRASRESVTVSDLMRRAIERELEGEPAPPPVDANAAIGPTLAAIVAGAARGDLPSLRHIFEDRLAELMRVDPRSHDALLVSAEAVLVGRLVASHAVGDDVHRFAGALCRAAEVLGIWGRPDLCDRLAVEAVSLLEELAERGDDLAAVASAELVACGPPDVPARVRELQRQASQSEPA